MLVLPEPAPALQEGHNPLLPHQFVETDGAFKFYTIRGQSWDYVATANIKASLPGKIPIKIYADIGTFYKATELYYDIGLQVSIINNIFDIYFPLAISKEMEETFNLMGNNKFYERIRFTLKLDKLNPFKYVDKPEMLVSF